MLQLRREAKHNKQAKMLQLRPNPRAQPPAQQRYCAHGTWRTWFLSTKNASMTRALSKLFGKFAENYQNKYLILGRWRLLWSCVQIYTGQIGIGKWWHIVGCSCRSDEGNPSYAKGWPGAGLVIFTRCSLPWKFSSSIEATSTSFFGQPNHFIGSGLNRFNLIIVISYESISKGFRILCEERSQLHLLRIGCLGKLFSNHLLPINLNALCQNKTADESYLPEVNNFGEV